MRILVCGAAGMLGSDVVRAASEASNAVTAAGRAELDVTDAGAVDEVVGGGRPNAVVNCAAWTDVDGAEEHEAEARRVNGDGAHNVAAAAAGAGASVVYVSSDYVFDGSRRGEPYLESDPPAPLSAYGRSKLAGELATAAACPRHFIVRSSWLFGANGPNFVDSMLRLSGERDEVRVVDDQVGCPTYSGHLADGIVALLETDAHGLHHMAAAGHCSWFELAQATFASAGVDCRAEPCRTAELPRPAPRPAWSVLESERDDAIELPHWTAGLEHYLAERELRA